MEEARSYDEQENDGEQKDDSATSVLVMMTLVLDLLFVSWF